MSHTDRIPVIDLFAGPGGLGEGFTSLAGSDRRHCFKVRLSIEKDSYAHQTLELRAFYRQFTAGRVPQLYYDVVRGTSSREDLFGRFPAEAANASAEAWHAELGVAKRSLVKERIERALGSSREWVLIGGPPCQAYSVAGRSRNRGVDGYRPDRDERQYLYTEYLQIIAELWPAIFVMENVKGLLSATLRNRRMFDLIHEDLESPARVVSRRSNGRSHRYKILSVSARDDLFEDVSVGNYVVHSEQHGIPQARHRVILLGVRDDLITDGSRECQLPECPETPGSKVIGRLPAIRSGLSRGADSPEAWLNTIRDARDRRWLKSARSTGGGAVQDLVMETIEGVTVPKCDRGADFIPGDFKTSYRPLSMTLRHQGRVN